MHGQHCICFTVVKYQRRYPQCFLFQVSNQIFKHAAFQIGKFQPGITPFDGDKKFCTVAKTHFQELAHHEDIKGDVHIQWLIAMAV